jgi:hypothetical protein
MPESGEVFFVPKEQVAGGDSKDRRHVLAHTCASSDGVVGSLYYATTQRTQSRFGLVSVVLQPRMVAEAPNGFDEETYVYPSAIVPLAASDLTAPVGSLSDSEQEVLRNVLASSLEVGSGTCYSSRQKLTFDNRVYRSLRGMIVQFAPALAAQLEGDPIDASPRFGIVVSSHRASAHPEAYQTIVPVLPHYVATHSDEIEILPARESWIAHLADDTGATVDVALVLIPETFYVHPSALRRTRFELVVSRELIYDIEQRLIARLTRKTVPACEEQVAATEGDEP